MLPMQASRGHDVNSQRFTNHHMTRHFAAIALSSLTVAAALSACSDDSNSYDEPIDPGFTSETMYSSTAITYFAIQPNTKILTGLDSVFFTIDQTHAEIFNADSLPKGTNVGRLLLDIGSETGSKLVLKYTDAVTNQEKEVDYSSSSSDSVNFFKPVTINVTSANAKYTRTYNVKVNVHQTEPDSLAWSEISYSTLPAPAGSTASKTVVHNGRVYCFSMKGSVLTVASTADPADGAAQWESSAVNCGFTPDVTTLAADDRTFYMLSSTGALYTSTDSRTWTSAGVTWHWIYGVSEGSAVGAVRNGSSYATAMYPAPAGFVSNPINDNMPVSGTSPAIAFTSEWSASPLLIMAGGRKADGSLSADVWGFDGTNWALFAKLPVRPAEGMMMCPYYTFDVNTTNWKVTRYNTLLLTGGRDANGDMLKTLYISRNNGVDWHTADELLQLPEDMPATAFASPVIWTSTLHARSISADNSWHELPLRRLPAWYTPAVNPSLSRATTPITQWECPYIYMYGGIDQNGDLSAQVWRGVINRLTFKPLQ